MTNAKTSCKFRDVIADQKTNGKWKTFVMTSRGVSDHSLIAMPLSHRRIPTDIVCWISVQETGLCGSAVLLLSLMKEFANEG